MKPMFVPIILAVLLSAGVAFAIPARQALLDGYAAKAGAAPSISRGKTFFQATHSGGKKDIASCSACHGKDPRASGRTRAGKTIDPLAVSVTPDRFSDPAKVEKWFTRNCDTVLGRACTPAEKADFIAYMSSL